MTAKLNKKCIRSNRKSVKNSSRWYARLYERFRPAGLDLPSRFAFSHPQPGKSLPPPLGFAHGAAAVLADAVRRGALRNRVGLDELAAATAAVVKPLMALRRSTYGSAAFVAPSASTIVEWLHDR